MYYLEHSLHESTLDDTIYEFCLIGPHSKYIWECQKENVYSVSGLEQFTTIFVKSSSLLFNECANVDSLPAIFTQQNPTTNFVSAVEANFKQERFSELVLIKNNNLVKTNESFLCGNCVTLGRNFLNCAHVLAISLKQYLEYE